MSSIRALTISAAVIAAIASRGTIAWADGAYLDEDYYKPKTQWTWGGDTSKRYNSPEAACKEGGKELAGKKTFLPPAKETAKDNERTCEFREASDNSIFTRTVTKLLVCPNNQNTYEHKGQEMCRYGKADCKSHPPKAPPKDTSGRCTPEKNPTDKTKEEAQKLADKARDEAAPRWIECYEAAKEEIEQEQQEAQKKKYGKDVPGYPEFQEGDLYPGPGPHTVNIGLLCGSRTADFAAANRIGGYAETPQLKEVDENGKETVRTFTWHHTENLGELQLVSSDSHGEKDEEGGKNGHWGGVSIWKRAFKVDYP